MRTTVSIDDELLRQAKLAAVESGQTLSDIVSEALRASLLRKQEKPRKRIRITTAGRGSRVIRGLDFSDNARVRAAMDEYDRRQLGLAGNSND